MSSPTKFLAFLVMSISNVTLLDFKQHNDPILWMFQMLRNASRWTSRWWRWMEMRWLKSFGNLSKRRSRGYWLYSFCSLSLNISVCTVVAQECAHTIHLYSLSWQTLMWSWSTLTWVCPTATRPMTRSLLTLHWQRRNTMWLSSVLPSHQTRPELKVGLPCAHCFLALQWAL